MIKRREFGKTLAGAGATMAASTQVAQAQSGRARAPKKNLLMHVGGDYHAVAGGPRADMTAKANLDYNLRHGVKHLTAQVWHEEAIPLFDADPWFGERAACAAPQPRDDVAAALLRRVGRYSLFATDAASIDHLVKLLGSLRLPGRIVVHEFREATPQANLLRSQKRLEEVRAALGGRAAGVEFVAAGSDNPRQAPVTQAMREMYSSVDVEVFRR